MMRDLWRRVLHKMGQEVGEDVLQLEVRLRICYRSAMVGDWASQLALWCKTIWGGWWVEDMGDEF